MKEHPELTMRYKEAMAALRRLLDTTSRLDELPGAGKRELGVVELMSDLRALWDKPEIRD